MALNILVWESIFPTRVTTSGASSKRRRRVPRQRGHGRDNGLRDPLPSPSRARPCCPKAVGMPWRGSTPHPGPLGAGPAQRRPPGTAAVPLPSYWTRLWVCVVSFSAGRPDGTRWWAEFQGFDAQTATFVVRVEKINIVESPHSHSLNDCQPPGFIKDSLAPHRMERRSPHPVSRGKDRLDLNEVGFRT